MVKHLLYSITKWTSYSMNSMNKHSMDSCTLKFIWPKISSLTKQNNISHSNIDKSIGK
uniref:Uncharacterized protein n=1 Tax=Rhizophagus irregularis (strain DAOM 181602 / DAOM 197198 / MUCL 43194) TaxID=747089 RepID=U9UHK0_RHIID